MNTTANSPLAERMRPKEIADFIGQEHLVGEGGLLSAILAGGHLPSLIFWGPPGVGKTTLAELLARKAGLQFFSLSAIQAGVKEVRQILDTAKKIGKSVLFIDEIHRFNKSQQDALLGAVEKGIILLIGATTENPSFEVNNALLSRSQVYPLNPLTHSELKRICLQAMEHDIILSKKNIEVESWVTLVSLADGDGRKVLNLLELVCLSEKSNEIHITSELLAKTVQQNVSKYDKNGEQHYDIISAFIKSIRGSDPNAAVYYLARMLRGGEDVKFIARRLIILASEDIGLANPTAMVIASSCFQSVQVVGMPESRIILSQCVIYLATSEKSNTAYIAINQALVFVDKTGDLPVPLSLRNAPTGLMKKMGYGADYQYAHDYEGNFKSHEFLPEKIQDKKLYDPGSNDREKNIRKWLKSRWQDKYGY